MKKRLLSLILAITMIATLLPAMTISAGAADVSYTYSFNPNNLVSGAALDTYKYADTNDTWEYVTAKSLNTAATYPQVYKRSSFSGMFIRWPGNGTPWAAFRIKVPTAGVYKVTIKYGERYVGASLNVYMLPSNITSLSGTESSFDAGYKLNDTVVNTLNAAQTGNVSTVVPVTLEKTFTTVADNEERIVVFDADESNKQQYVYIAELVLEKVGDVCTVTYNANGGVVETESTVVEAGAKITLPTPSKDGNEFLGWSDGANAYPAGSEYVVNASVTLVAEWKKLGSNSFVYDFGKILGEVNTEAEYTSYEDTSAMWQMNTKSREALSILKYAKGFRARTSAGYWVSFKINVPASGKYDVFLNHYQLVAASTIKAGYGNVYLLDGNTADIESALETTLPLNSEEVAYVSSEIESARTPKTKLCEEYEIEKGEYILVFKSMRKHPDCHSEAGTYAISLVLESEADCESYAGAVVLGNDELTVGSGTSVSAKVFNAADGAVATEEITYSSSDDTVIRIEENVIKAVGVGDATISATIESSLPYNIIPAKVTVVDTTDNGVVFGKGSNVDSKIEIDGTIKRGDKVTLTAEDIEGYKFIGWKRGNANTGKFIVGAPQENFEYTVYSNSFITAIYEKEDAASASGVEFWNKNGELVAEYSAEEFGNLSALPAASLIGHTFKGWQTSDEKEFELSTPLGSGITRVVAVYEANDIAGPFSCADVTSEIDAGSMKFNAPIIASTTSSTFSCWMRNEMIVSYDKDYTYYVFKASNIDNSKVDVPDDKKPIVILEEGYGAYMIEFDEADYDIVEAGIIAGNGVPTVASCAEKHIAQNAGAHGQFAVELTEEYSAVRGYVIYKDGSEYKIIYAD